MLRARLLKAKAKDQERIFSAVVYGADRGGDLQGDEIGPNELWGASAQFGMAPQIKLMHGGEQLPDGTVGVIGSFMTSSKYGKFPKQSWVLTCQVAKTVLGDCIWSRIKGGWAGKDTIEFDGKEYPSLRGFSLAGTASRVEVG